MRFPYDIFSFLGIFCLFSHSKYSLLNIKIIQQLSLTLNNILAYNLNTNLFHLQLLIFDLLHNQLEFRFPKDNAIRNYIVLGLLTLSNSKIQQDKFIFSYYLPYYNSSLQGIYLE